MYKGNTSSPSTSASPLHTGWITATGFNAAETVDSSTLVHHHHHPNFIHHPASGDDSSSMLQQPSSTLSAVVHTNDLMSGLSKLEQEWMSRNNRIKQQKQQHGDQHLQSRSLIPVTTNNLSPSSSPVSVSSPLLGAHSFSTCTSTELSQQQTQQHHHHQNFNLNPFHNHHNFHRQAPLHHSFSVHQPEWAMPITTPMNTVDSNQEIAAAAAATTLGQQQFFIQQHLLQQQHQQSQLQQPHSPHRQHPMYTAVHQLKTVNLNNVEGSTSSLASLCTFDHKNNGIGSQQATLPELSSSPPASSLSPSSTAANTMVMDAFSFKASMATMADLTHSLLSSDSENQFRQDSKSQEYGSYETTVPPLVISSSSSSSSTSASTSLSSSFADDGTMMSSSELMLTQSDESKGKNGENATYLPNPMQLMQMPMSQVFAAAEYYCQQQQQQQQQQHQHQLPQHPHQVFQNEPLSLTPSTEYLQTTSSGSMLTGRSNSEGNTVIGHGKRTRLSVKRQSLALEMSMLSQQQKQQLQRRRAGSLQLPMSTSTNDFTSRLRQDPKQNRSSCHTSFKATTTSASNGSVSKLTGNGIKSINQTVSSLTSTTLNTANNRSLPCVCQICHKTYANQSTLRRHTKIHVYQSQERSWSTGAGNGLGGNGGGPVLSYSRSLSPLNSSSASSLSTMGPRSVSPAGLMMSQQEFVDNQSTSSPFQNQQYLHPLSSSLPQVETGGHRILASMNLREFGDVTREERDYNGNNSDQQPSSFNNNDNNNNNDGLFHKTTNRPNTRRRDTSSLSSSPSSYVNMLTMSSLSLSSPSLSSSASSSSTSLPLVIHPNGSSSGGGGREMNQNSISTAAGSHLNSNLTSLQSTGYQRILRKPECVGCGKAFARRDTVILHIRNLNPKALYRPTTDDEDDEDDENGGIMEDGEDDKKRNKTGTKLGGASAPKKQKPTSKMIEKRREGSKCWRVRKVRVFGDFGPTEESVLQQE